jgi:outer membrane protein OmpA-like peptidoglycan-associated protein
MDTGKRLLPALFGSSEQTVTNAISREAGLSSGAITTLLTMAAPVVMSFISKQVRDGGMTMSGLGNLLQRESSTIRNALPSGLSEIFWPAATTTTTTTSTASPVIAQSVQKEKSVSWLPIAASAALGLGLFWFLGQGHRPPIQTVVTPIPTGSANRYAIPAPRKLCSVPDNANIPENGSAARLLAFAQNPDNRAAAAGWLNIDQMSFATGSATLQPASARQLNTIATVMTNCPGVHLEIAGYTDNVGSGDANLRLSRNRANAVVAQLVKEGVPRDRLMARGFGEEYPQADNATAEGRAENRRVAMKVIQK